MMAKRTRKRKRYELKIGREWQVIKLGRRYFQSFTPVHNWSMLCPCLRDDCPNTIHFKLFLS